MLISQPAEMPVALLDGLRTFFETRPDISVAYFAQASGSNMDDDAHYLIGVAMGADVPLWQKLLKDMGPIIAAAALPKRVEVEPIYPGNPADPWFAALKIYEPFYTRKSS
jgi:hypothetical protein